MTRVMLKCLVVVPSVLLIVPFILIVLNLALKQAVAMLPLVNVQRARDVGLVKINLKHLMDALINEMLLLMASEHLKNKIYVIRKL